MFLKCIFEGFLHIAIAYKLKKPEVLYSKDMWYVIIIVLINNTQLLTENLGLNWSHTDTCSWILL